jgi:hypothetical protein
MPPFGNLLQVPFAHARIGAPDGKLDWLQPHCREKRAQGSECGHGASTEQRSIFLGVKDDSYQLCPFPTASGTRIKDELLGNVTPLEKNANSARGITCQVPGIRS